MVNIDKLKGTMVEKGFNVEKLAKNIGMNRATLYRRMENSGKNITIAEADAICKALELTGQEAFIIFFNQYVTYKRQGEGEM